MRPNKLRDLLKSNKPTLSTHIHTTWPSMSMQLKVDQEPRGFLAQRARIE